MRPLAFVRSVSFLRSGPHPWPSESKRRKLISLEKRFDVGSRVKGSPQEQGIAGYHNPWVTPQTRKNEMRTVSMSRVFNPSRCDHVEVGELPIWKNNSIYGRHLGERWAESVGANPIDDSNHVSFKSPNSPIFLTSQFLGYPEPMDNFAVPTGWGRNCGSYVKERQWSAASESLSDAGA